MSKLRPAVIAFVPARVYVVARRAAIATVIIVAILAAKPADQFATINGVRLQYVDWGGTGDAILLLPGLGDSVHRFDAFAPRFTDAFRVVGFSRRGQGASDTSSSKYDTETLVEDIRQFLAAMHVDRVDIIGHSIAGVEMTRFAALYPKRVRHLVYLDAAYDYGRATEVGIAANLIPPPKTPGTPLELIQADAGRTHPDFAAVRAPALAFFVINKPQPTVVGLNWFEAFEVGYKGEQIENFKREMTRGNVVVFGDTDHFFFVDPNKIDGVVAQVRRFLAKP